MENAEGRTRETAVVGSGRQSHCYGKARNGNSRSPYIFHIDFLKDACSGDNFYLTLEVGGVNYGRFFINHTMK